MATSLDEYYRGLEAAAAALGGVPRTVRGADPAAAAAAVHAASSAWLAAAPERPRACRDGCAHCCHFPVGVTFGEALRLHLALAEHGAESHQRVLAACRAPGAATPWEQLVGHACPLLEHGRCRAYEARPLPCRALASRSAEACAAALHGSGEVPRDEVAFWRGLGAVAALDRDEPIGSRELRSALLALHEGLGHRPRVEQGELAAVLASFAAARPVP
ncbi:MAG: YkgJ family cysteine cluster protein [Planctomycetes bacterium]|nr:YkgJ family cysteine cluster protein [Planctomycetota bacterium]